MAIRWHEDDPALLREAIRFTSAETGFNPRLIEKDYFCSVLLEHLTANYEALLFKGGTCLTKVHSGFYRLSEDLDFSISTPVDSTRATRSRSVALIKSVVNEVPKQLRGFQVEEPLTGSNSSTQYNATISYLSLLGTQPEVIRIEIGLREPCITDTHHGAANTVVLNPVHRQAFVEAFPVLTLSYPEAMAEKLRAALCRREVAIRDFFDIDYAVRNKGLDTHDTELHKLLRAKLAVPGTSAVNVTLERLAQLRRQLDAQLRPVLRAQEFEQFDLDRAIGIVHDVARAVV